MRPGDTVNVADFEAALTDLEKSGLHYILAHFHRTARESIALPKLEGVALEFYTERELIAFRTFYARQAG